MPDKPEESEEAEKAGGESAAETSEEADVQISFPFPAPQGSSTSIFDNAVP